MYVSIFILAKDNRGDELLGRTRVTNILYILYNHTDIKQYIFDSQIKYASYIPYRN